MLTRSARKTQRPAAADDQEASGGGVFCTVGTTSFDALIAAVDSKAFVAAARRAGYTSLTMQVGRGVRLPTTLLPDGATEACEDGFTVRYFRFAPDLSAYVRGAGLVVSHAGAGSIFEALRAKKPLLVVVNEALMDNHQAELAEALAAGNHLRHCTPEGLVQALTTLRPEQLTPWVCGSGARHAAAIDQLCGFGPA